MQAAAGFVKGWLEARDVEVTGATHNGRPVLAATVGRRQRARRSSCTATSTWCPGHEEQFAPRVAGDKLFGRGAYDMKGGLAAMMCATRDLAAQSEVRVHFVCIADEESDELEERGSDYVVAQGYTGDFAITGEPTDLHIGVAGQGRAGAAARDHRRGGPRLHALARRQRGAQGDRRLPQHRVDGLRARVLRPVRPPEPEPRPDPRRRRREQGARLLRASTWTSATCRARTRRRSAAEIEALPDTQVVKVFQRAPIHVDARQPLRAGAGRGDRGRGGHRRQALGGPRRHLRRHLVHRRRACPPSSSGRSAAATTAPRSGCRSPRSSSAGRRSCEFVAPGARSGWAARSGAAT